MKPIIIWKPVNTKKLWMHFSKPLKSLAKMDLSPRLYIVHVVQSILLKKDYQKAIESYEKAFQLSDSLSSAQEDISVGEFATILGMEHLNLENKELIQKSQEIQLEKRRYLIILLCIIVVIVGVMFFRETRLNKVLRRAKDAEQSASRMKTGIHTEYEP